jgi:hypothetical protein
MSAADDNEYYSNYLNLQQIPITRTLFSFRTVMPTPMPKLIHTNENNTTTSTASYVPLTASVHAGALITGARLDVGLFAFLFIILGEHVL